MNPSPLAVVAPDGQNLPHPTKKEGKIQKRKNVAPLYREVPRVANEERGADDSLRWRQTGFSCTTQNPVKLWRPRRNKQTMVGAAGFEPAASCSQGRRANQAALRPDTAIQVNRSTHSSMLTGRQGKSGLLSLLQKSKTACAKLLTTLGAVAIVTPFLTPIPG